MLGVLLSLVSTNHLLTTTEYPKTRHSPSEPNHIPWFSKASTDQHFALVEGGETLIQGPCNMGEGCSWHLIL